MLHKIKNYLYKKQVLRVNSVYDKIFLILNNKIDLRKLYNLSNTFIFDNVIRYHNELKYILKQDLLKNEIELYKVAPGYMHSMKYLSWFSPDGRVPIGTEEVILELVTDMQKFHIKYDILSKMKNDSMLLYNVRMLQTHIIYIDNIIEDIFNCIVTD